MDKNEYVFESWTLERKIVEDEVGRKITDEEWGDFIDEIVDAVDYYYLHNFDMLCRDLRDGVPLGGDSSEDDEDENEEGDKGQSVITIEFDDEGDEDEDGDEGDENE